MCASTELSGASRASLSLHLGPCSLASGVTGDSKDFHTLPKYLIEARWVAIARARGWEAGPGLLGKVMGEIHQAKSVQVVRIQAM